MSAPDHAALLGWLQGRQAEVEHDHRANAGILPTSCYCDVPEPCEDRIQQLAAIEELRAILTRSAELVAENMRIHRELEAALDGNQRLQTMNEGLRQMAIQAREAANSWQQATIDLYSGREEAAPQPIAGSDDPAAPWNAPCSLTPAEGAAFDAALASCREDPQADEIERLRAEIRRLEQERDGDAQAVKDAIGGRRTSGKTLPLRVRQINALWDRFADRIAELAARDGREA